MICIIGNAPSAGSTFLADLLDSTPDSVCGPELNLFSNRKLYDFARYRRNVGVTSPSGSIHRLRIGLNFDRLYSYGHDRATYTRMVRDSADLNEFVERFGCYYKALRGKNQRALLFEKTPENINAIGEFLEALPDGHFIHITRDPLHIYPSLLKRGFAPYVSLLTWLLDVAMVHPYRDHERVILVKYEELVQRPFELTSELLRRITGTAPTPDAIEAAYMNNEYRKIHSKKIATWSVREYGTVRDANRKELPDQVLRDTLRLLHARVRPRYAARFRMAPLSFREAVDSYGYAGALQKVMDRVGVPAEIPRPDPAALLRLGRKWLADFARGDAGPGLLGAYLRPIVRD
jgi:hypothetical protein